MTALFDADFLVEVLRKSQSAQNWPAANRTLRAAVPSIVAMELYLGCPNKREMDATRKVLGQYATAHLRERDSVLALELFRTHRLAHGLSIGDALVAAMAVNRSATLISFNVKHFSAVKGLAVQAPYAR